MNRLPDPQYMAFPFKIDANGAARAGRADHIRQCVEQLVFTHPGERVFRREFGAGAQFLVFEPNAGTLVGAVQQRLTTALGEILKGEADPRTVRVTVTPDEEKLVIEIAYTLSAIGQDERITLAVNRPGGGNG